MKYSGAMIAALGLMGLPLGAQISVTPPPIAAFQQPEVFIDKCPTNDPIYSTIRSDFAILRDGNPVGPIQCVEPFTAMQPAQYSEELIIVQALRMAYYIDQGRENYLPWTTLRFYDWLKSKISYFNILSNATSASCCAVNGTKKGIFYSSFTDVNTRRYHFTLRGVVAIMALIGHETRHVDGYLHNSCCSTPNGCDQTYNEGDLSAYGIQYYIQRLILTGQWNLNIGCLDGALLGAFGTFQILDADVYADRFCTVKPPKLAADVPVGAACQPGPYPYISQGGIANAASYKTDQIAPGALIGIFGPNLATATDRTLTLPLPAQLANVSVDIAGRVSPLWSVNNATAGSLA